MVTPKPFSKRILRYCRAVFFEVLSMLNVTMWFRQTPKFELDQLAQAREFLDAHGWVIIRQVFSPDEVKSLRVGVMRASEESLTGDLLMHPTVGGDRFLLHERFLVVVKAMLSGTPVHFGDASVSIGFQSTPAFHKDNPDRQNGMAPDWQSPYTIVRFGVYLQDHRTHSGGLALRDYSNNTADINRGRPFAVPTEPGDVVLWSLRTTHSGFATRLRGLVNAFVPLTIMAVLLGKKRYSPSTLLFRPLDAEPRIALFAAFGIKDAHLDRYLKHLKTRDYAVRRWQATRYSDEMHAEARNSGIEMIDVTEQVQDIDLRTLNVGYVPLSDA